VIKLFGTNGGGVVKGGFSKLPPPPPVAVRAAFFSAGLLAFCLGCAGVDIADPETKNPKEEVIPAAEPVIKTHPQDAVYQAGTAAVPLSVQAESPDGGVLSYQWYSGAENSKSASLAVLGATGASYTPPTVETGVVYYYVTVTNAHSEKEAAPPPASSEAPGDGESGGNAASVASSAARIEVNNLVNAALPAVSIYTGQKEYCVGDSAESIVAAAPVTDGGTVTVTWYKNGQNSNTGGASVSAGNNEYTPSTQTVGTFYYYFTAVNTIPDNGDGGVKSQSATSDVVEITVIEPIRNISELQTFFEQAGDSGASAAEPCVLPPVIWEDDGGWNTLFGTINAAGKYVALDMSKTLVGAAYVLPDVFSYASGDTDNARAGKGCVVSFVLPDGINSINYDVEAISSTLEDFIAIKTASGAGVETIGEYAFYGRSSLVAVDFPLARTIENSAFRECSSLVAVDFPLAETIEEYAFRECSSLEAVNFPLAETIGLLAFYGCSSLVTVNFPLAETIWSFAFRECSSLVAVNFPLAKTIEEYAFRECSSLEAVNFPLAETIKKAAFWECASLETVSFPKIEKIYTSVFALCSALEEITDARFPRLKEIGASAFGGCTSLRTVNLSNVETIGNSVFESCAALETVNLPVAQDMGEKVFSGCVLLQTITLGQTAPALGARIFEACNSTQAVTVNIPAGAGDYGTSGTYSGANATACWANGFRGMGWNGSAFTSYAPGNTDLNQNITVVLQTIQ
jgi:hypothetical protein